MTQNEKINLVISAKNQASGTLSSIKTQILAVGGAYLSWRAGSDIIRKMLSLSTQYEANMVSLAGVVAATGRDMNEVLTEMSRHMGGLASDINVTTGFLKGMSTKLTTQEISNLTAAVKDASIAMGEDFNYQLPLIIKAIKQLNPAILDNIGVTIRLDQVNQRITQGYYGLNTEINEATQQQAVYAEIMRQTQIFKGQEEKYLQTAQGRWRQLTAATDNALTSMGRMITEAFSRKLITNIEDTDDATMRLVEALNSLSNKVTPTAYQIKGFALEIVAAYQSVTGLVGVLGWAEITLGAFLSNDIKGAQSYFNQLKTAASNTTKDLKKTFSEIGTAFASADLPASYWTWLDMIEGTAYKTKSTAIEMREAWESEWQNAFMSGMTSFPSTSTFLFDLFLSAV